MENDLKLDLSKLIKNKKKVYELSMKNHYISENIFPLQLNYDILLNFNITNTILHEYIIKTNTNSLIDYDIAVTNLGTVIYNDMIFKNFILCLDNNARFTITAIKDKIPTLWDSNKYYEIGTPTLDWIYFPNREIRKFDINEIIDIQFLLYLDFKYQTYKKIHQKRYSYNFLEFLCSMFFKDINNPNLSSIKNIIINIYKELMNINFKISEIENLSASLLFQSRIEIHKNISDIRLLDEFLDRMNKKKINYSKNSFISVYLYDKDHNSHDIKHFLNEYYSTYLLNNINTFYDMLFHFNYIPNKFCHITYSELVLFHKKENKIINDIDLYEYLIKLNKNIPEMYIRRLFDISSLIRFSGSDLILNKSIKEIYEVILSSDRYIKYLNNKYKVSSILNIPEDLWIYVKYKMEFKYIYHLRIQKLLKEDKVLQSLFKYSIFFPNVFKFQKGEYDLIRCSIFKYLIKTLFYVSELFLSNYRKHIFYYKNYQELKLVIDFSDLINNYHQRINFIKDKYIIQESIDVGCVLNRMDPNFNQPISNIINSDYYFNIITNINKTQYRIGCLSASRYISNISTYSDSTSYLVDHNSNSEYNYNQYFFSRMSMNILK